MRQLPPIFFMALMICLLGIIGLLTPMGMNLEYEYALSLAILILCFVPTLVYAWPFAPAIPMRTLPHSIIAEMSLVFLVVPIIALVPGSLALFWNYCACGKSEFLFWMALLVMPSWVVGYGIWSLLNAFREQGIPRPKLVKVHLAMIILLIGHLAAMMWFNPQKRMTHLFAGFLHGPIYDTWLPMDQGIVIIRLSHLTLGVCLWFWAAAKRGHAKAKWVAVIMFFSTLGLSGYGSRFPSVGMGISALEEQLPQHISTPNYILHYRSPKEGPAPLSIQQLAWEADFHISDLKKIIPPPLPLVHIFVYPDDDSKKLWFGGGATDVTDVWTPSIHITNEGFPHPTLRHELVHALASDQAFHGLGFHPNMMFTEGLAVALAPEDRLDSMNEDAAYLLGSGKVKEVSSLLSPLFWEESGARAYTLAGSLLQFLLKKYGGDSVFQLYAGASWDQAFHSGRDVILQEWQRSLQPLFDPGKASLQKEALYRRPGVLKDLCPHNKATLRRSPTDHDIWLRLRQPLGWNPTNDYWPWRQSLDANDPDAQLNRLRKIIQDQIKKGNDPTGNAQVMAELKSDLHWPPRNIEDVELALLISDFSYLVETSSIESEKILQQIMSLPSAALSDGMKRQVEARYWIVQNIGPRDTPAWRRYLAGWGQIPTETKNEPWILQYLRLRKGDVAYRQKKILDHLSKLTPKAEGFNPSFITEWYRILGQRYLEHQSWELAADAFKKAAATASEGQQPLLQQYQQMAQFLSSSVTNSKLKK